MIVHSFNTRVQTVCSVPGILWGAKDTRHLNPALSLRPTAWGGGGCHRNTHWDTWGCCSQSACRGRGMGESGFLPRYRSGEFGGAPWRRELLSSVWKGELEEFGGAVWEQGPVRRSGFVGPDSGVRVPEGRQGPGGRGRWQTGRGAQRVCILLSRRNRPREWGRAEWGQPAAAQAATQMGTALSPEATL